jgi:hypothetical protein
MIESTIFSKEIGIWNQVKCVWLNPEKIQVAPGNHLKEAA